jgi:MtrB/PioB family decaheme-associated outer membrane protein
MSTRMTVELKLAPLAAALLLAFGSVHAQPSEEVRSLTAPDTGSFTLGVGANNAADQARRLGQYTGLNKDGALLLDFEVQRREEATGTWTSILGRDLGQDTRELGISVQKQGDWRYGMEYNEIVRNDPYVIHTGTVGLGSSTPVINLIALPTLSASWQTANGLLGSNGVAGHDETLKLKRTAIGLSGDKWISPELQLEVSFRNEEKKGARMFGRAALNSSDMAAVPTIGTSANANGNWAVLLTPEPVDSTIRSIESRLNFNRDKLALSAGYYGSFYTNNNTSLTPAVPAALNRGALWNGVTGTANTIQQSASSSVALPPDNQAHQLYFSGSYAYSDTTRTNFKLSYTHATQSEDFVGAGLLPAATAPGNLGGVVDTTLAQLGLTMRPIKELSINASLRYEDRADRTPVAVYNYGKLGGSLDQTTNWPSASQTRTTAKVDGIYRLAQGYSLNAGMEWERKATPLPATHTAIFNNQVFFRDSLDETGMRLGLRRAMSETLNGALSYEYKQRRGADDGWRTGSLSSAGPLVAVNPALATTNNVLADMYMDRDRTKVRASLDWDASDRVSVQLAAEHGQDDFLRAWTPITAPSPQVIPVEPGARTNNNDSVTLDASYKLSEVWRIGGYWTHSESRWQVNKVGIGDDTRNLTDTFGLGIKGHVAANFNIGLDVLAANDNTRFNNFVAPTVAGLATPTATTADINGNIVGFNGTRLPGGNYLPQINYNTLKLNLYGIYDLDKKSSIKVNLAYQEFKTDDWQWGYNGVPFLYSDNTTVSSPNQIVTFLGVAFVRKF